MELKVYEQFVSIQGEGPSAGKPAVFYRFAGCQLRCWFCDTKVAWMTKNETAVTYVSDVPLVVITGGEPLWGQNREMAYQLIKYYLDKGVSVEVETNGVEGWIEDFSDKVRYIVSPKFFDIQKAEEVVNRWKSRKNDLNFVFKFVVDNLDDFSVVQSFVKGFPGDRVWIMPQASTLNTLLDKSKMIIDEVLKNRWNFSSRLQILLSIK